MTDAGSCSTGTEVQSAMGNVARKARCSPSDEDKKIDIFKYTKLDGFPMDTVPDDLVAPILMRFDHTRVHTTVSWNKRFYHSIGKHFQIWRPRVIINFSTELVFAGKGRALGCILTLKVYVPKSNSTTPLGPADCKKVMLTEQFMFYTGENEDELNKSVLQKFYKRLKNIMKNMTILRVIFDLNDYPLLPSTMEAISKAFIHKRCHFPSMGVQVRAERVEGMCNFFATFQTRYFELTADSICQEEKTFKQANIVINRNTEEDPEHMRQLVHDVIAEWRAGTRDINVYKVCNYRPEVMKLIKRDWISIICSCSREMVVYGPELRALRVGVMGPDLIIRRIPFE